MTCPHCHQETGPGRVRRHSKAVVTLGMVLWVLGAAGAIAATAFSYVLHPGEQEPVDVVARAKEAAIAGLYQLAGVPEAVIAEFDATGEVPDHLLERLDPETRGEVDLLVSDLRHTVRTARPPEPPPPWWAARWLWAVYGGCLVALVAGGLCRLTTEPDQCPRCGAALDGDDTALI